MAWISEQKNTLSAVFYLGAMLCYLRFDRTRRLRLRRCSRPVRFVLFDSTDTFPGALLVIFWWRRSRLSWKKDVLPLVPFFLIGAGGGMITAWWELKINRCLGPDFAFTFVQRLLIAGRAVWFCCGKLFWPAELTFSYPRWQIHAGVWWQYLCPLGAAAALAVSWAIRRWSRAPLAALLFFGGTLFPVLGFFKLYTFRYSLVADHYQYLASLGIITLFSAGVASLVRGWTGGNECRSGRVCVLLVVLAAASWRQSGMYADAETLYRTTLARNPDSGLAHASLGNALVARGQFDEGIAPYRKALEITPDFVEAQYNLGNALARRGQLDEAIQPFPEGFGDQARPVDARRKLAVALPEWERILKSLAERREAIRLRPNDAALLNDTAWMLATNPNGLSATAPKSVELAQGALHSPVAINQQC